MLQNIITDMVEEKRLFLIRHGKSSWGYENVADTDRPLKNRGIRNAYEMAARLKKKGVIADQVISSPAVRALHTALIFASELGFSSNDLKINDILYFADEISILNFIKDTSDAVSCQMLFGHNPIITNLANMFFETTVDYIPTAGIADITFTTNSWSKVSKNNVKQVFYDFPKKN